jgi:hypothetical protein
MHGLMSKARHGVSTAAKTQDGAGARGTARGGVRPVAGAGARSRKTFWLHEEWEAENACPQNPITV